jgi:hypothetical protein
MRRIAPAMAPALGFVAATLPMLPAQSAASLDSASWSSQVRVATKVAYPDKIKSVHMHAGPRPGETTIRWRSGGEHTDYYKIETALTPFSPYKPSMPDKGRHYRVFKAPGKARSLTLTPRQTRKAGARLGSGRHLFFRILAVRHARAGTKARAYGPLQFATIAGRSPASSGTPIRVASYNVRVAAADVSGHTWAARTPLVAANIARQHPAVMAIEELVPGMWTSKDGGPGLAAALANKGLGRYRLTRDTTWSSTTPGDARILYDPDRLQMTSNCDPNQKSCGISLPAKGDVQVAPYAKFRDLTSGREFWFVAAHLSSGNNAATDRLRGKQAQTIINRMNQINTENLPVIFGADLNSSQTSKGHDAPHNAFVSSGYYDTSAAAKQVHLQYNTVNAFATRERRSNYGFGARLDAILTRGMPGANKFEEVITGAPYPSDHNMVVANLKLPGSS